MRSETIIKAFILGFGTLALGYFLAYHLSPDYLEMCSNGNSHLWFVGFSILLLVAFYFIDKHFEKKITAITDSEDENVTKHK